MSKLLLLLVVAVVACAAISVSATSAVKGQFTPPKTVLGQFTSTEPTLAEREEIITEMFVHQLGLESADGVGSGDKNCIVCTLVLSLMEQYAWDHSVTLSDATTAWCGDATAEVPFLDGACQLFMDPIATKAQADFENKISPDISCRTTLASCNGTAATCTLFPTWPPPPHSTETPRAGVRDEWSVSEQHVHYAAAASKLMNVHSINEAMMNVKISELAEAGLLPENLKHLQGEWIPVPIPDWDQDKYGATFTYRGIQFRGKDCNDKDATVYPGKNAFQGDFDATVDTNCNGISGVDKTSGVAWEQALCEPTPSRGILAIGDSATAHFSLPPTYVTPAGFNMTTYAALIQELVTEADWPQCSWSTAWGNSSTCPHSILNVSSIYQKMVERNRCMHRDYVNAGVNGASVRNLVEDGPVVPSNYSGAMLAYPDRYKNDGPSTVFFSMIGNDICSSRADYTTVDEFRQKAEEEFAYLDTKLSKGSHVIIMGVVDGRVLWNTLVNAIHPIGTPYPDFYDYLNCLEISPCYGWMNSDESIRNASSAQAALLNQQYAYIMGNNTYQNFDLHYFYMDYAAVIAKWVQEGHSALDLIEPVDGFHPSQTGNMLLAQNMWLWLEAFVPDSLGVENPNNDEIIAMFGDQGGYE